MRYESQGDIVLDARIVARAGVVPQSQESLVDQLRDLISLANRFGLYDAADYLRRDLDQS